MRPALSVVTKSPEETRILGAALAPWLVPGDIVSLTGDLGAGKTVFVQGVASALGVGNEVRSPSFTIVNEYGGRYPLVHMDVYRLGSFQEVIDLGFEEMLDSSSILLIEWGEAVAPLLPPRYLEVEIRRVPDVDAWNDRLVRFRPHTYGWQDKLDEMRRSAEALLDAASPEESTGARFFLDDSPARGGER